MAYSQQRESGTREEHSERQAISRSRSNLQDPSSSPPTGNTSIENLSATVEATRSYPNQKPSRRPRRESIQHTPVGKLQGTEFQIGFSASEHSSCSDQELGRKRKRSHEAEDLLPDILSKPPEKRPRPLPATFTVEDISRQETANNTSENNVDPINHWIREGSWPKAYFEQPRNDLNGEFVRASDMSRLLARQKSSASLRRKNSESSIITPSDQKPREEKCADYRTTRYDTVLATKGSFMNESELGITERSKKDYYTLLNAEQTPPKDSLFGDDLFKETCLSVQTRNEARIVRDISPLICPSAEVLAIYSSASPKLLIDSVNEGWNSAIPVTSTRPQPDYSVGFRRSAFTDEQLNKLTPFVGEVTDTCTSYFMATWQMYFPFLTCEVKCGAVALDVADRQNAHSMTHAVRAVVELFKFVEQEQELHREILAFSLSHDYRTVRIYGHYALIDGDKTTFYRHPIRTFDFTELDGKEKWVAYRFTRNVYDTWMPKHLQRIRSAIDKIPADLKFDVSSVTGTEDRQEMVASTAQSQETGPFKKPRLPPKVALQNEIDRLQERSDEQNDRNNQLMGQIDLLKQSSSSTGNELLLQQANDQLKERLDEQKQVNDRLMQQMDEQKQQMKQQMDQLMDLLKMKTT